VTALEHRSNIGSMVRGSGSCYLLGFVQCSRPTSGDVDPLSSRRGLRMPAIRSRTSSSSLQITAVPRSPRMSSTADRRRTTLRVLKPTCAPSWMTDWPTVEPAAVCTSHSPRSNIEFITGQDHGGERIGENLGGRGIAHAAGNRQDPPGIGDAGRLRACLGGLGCACLFDAEP
jgi:hypothetical protein